MNSRTLFLALAIAAGSPVAFGAEVRGAPVEQQPGSSRSGVQSDQGSTGNEINRRPTPVSPAAPGDPAYQSPDDMNTGSGECAPGDTSQRCRDASRQQEGGATSRPQPIAPATPADPASRNYDRR
ncbi:MAG: hypothetical protein JZU45_05710 [Methyloversatilis discipulorum]|jgi:hypothetical protein|uniref:hypothetical protein n=1 Tax=Methyloversatilis discipulorum TaxID=1119528 RepID=UPI0026EECEE8|nr:hypothetical protein [Methyloversatilis discipulorum]MBV5285558.1 hypothetical protein [Methyloversatilis discipulorum]